MCGEQIYGQDVCTLELSHVHAARALCRQISSELTGVGVRLFWQSKRLVYRFRWPWRGKLLHLDHVTVPVTDLRVAEDF